MPPYPSSTRLRGGANLPRSSCAAPRELLPLSEHHFLYPHTGGQLGRHSRFYYEYQSELVQYTLEEGIAPHEVPDYSEPKRAVLSPSITETSRQ